MFEKVSPYHPDKLSDRIAGSIIDFAYNEMENPKVAVEVLLGHGNCKIITESNINFADEKYKNKVFDIVQGICEVDGITKSIATEIIAVKQDEHLSQNQEKELKCGDNGIFKGVPVSREEQILTDLVKKLCEKYPYDSKFVLSLKDNKLIACQSNVKSKGFDEKIEKILHNDLDFALPPDFKIIVNPLGDWTGGIDVDTGATMRKLGSDMGRAVTGGGLYKDLSKADTSVNIVCHLLAQKYNQEVSAFCAIGDAFVKFEFEKPIVGNKDCFAIWEYKEVVRVAREYIDSIGGFEKFAEWGLIR